MRPVVVVEGLRVEAVSDAGRMVEILRGVSLEVGEGEVVALIGESGSGKTTVAMSLLGHARPGCRISGGRVVVDGEDMTRLDEAGRRRVRGAKVAYVPQSAAAAFDPAMRIMDQVIEVTRIHGLMPAEAARRKAVELFRALSLPDPEGIGARYPHQVSGGQLQRLAAAMALMSDPKVVIFDEPTTALDVTTQLEVLLAFKSVLRGKRICGVYVSHDLAVVAQIADRIVVLRDGEVRESGATRAILAAPQAPYTRELLAAFTPPPLAVRAVPDSAPAPLLAVRDLSIGYGRPGADGHPPVRAVRGVSFDVWPGGNLGIIGESGCGKSTLARAIAGIHPAYAGTLDFEGRRLAGRYDQRRRDELRRIQIVFQHADTALNPRQSVAEILGRPLRFYHGLAGGQVATRVDRLLDMVRLPRGLRERRPGELSGGQKQRVNLARALAAEPRLILCDEITSALDTVVAAAVVALLRELQRELDLSYVFISHDLSMVRAVCDAVVVMYRGEAVERLVPASGAAPTHPYARRLFDAVPRLDPDWLEEMRPRAAQG